MKRHIFHYDIGELAPYIDWSYFLHAWGLNGNRQRCATANEVTHEARTMLSELEGKYQVHAIFALCNACGDGDNISIEGHTLPLLRQQHTSADEPNLCLSDFVSPYSDKVGVFATTVDHEFGKEYSNDEYMSIIAQAIADRLAEAAATLLHRDVRREPTLWGYSPEEALTPEELNRELYQGIRPAIGYPSLPDQSIIFIIDKLLKMEEIGISITDNGAMHPHSSVCGIMLSHPQSRYFAVGKISEEQLYDYASRRDTPAELLRKYLAKNI